MKTYNDREFCVQESCKWWDGCDRALNDEVKEASSKLKVPVRFFIEKPECYEDLSNLSND